MKDLFWKTACFFFVVVAQNSRIYKLKKEDAGRAAFRVYLNFVLMETRFGFNIFSLDSAIQQ